MTTATVLFCHGARSARWREPFDALVAQCRQQAPQRRFELAFLELMQPEMAQVVDRLVAEGFTSIEVVPLFLAPGSHTERDLPALMQACRERHPLLAISAQPSLLERPEFATWLLAHIAPQA